MRALVAPSMMNPVLDNSRALAVVLVDIWCLYDGELSCRVGTFSSKASFIRSIFLPSATADSISVEFGSSSHLGYGSSEIKN